MELTGFEGLQGPDAWNECNSDSVELGNTIPDFVQFYLDGSVIILAESDAEEGTCLAELRISPGNVDSCASDRRILQPRQPEQHCGDRLLTMTSRTRPFESKGISGESFPSPVETSDENAAD